MSMTFCEMPTTPSTPPKQPVATVWSSLTPTRSSVGEVTTCPYGEAALRLKELAPSHPSGSEIAQAACGDRRFSSSVLVGLPDHDDARQPRLPVARRAGLPGRLRRPPSKGLRPLRDHHRHRTVHRPGRTGHDLFDQGGERFDAGRKS